MEMENGSLCWIVHINIWRTLQIRREETSPVDGGPIIQQYRVVYPMSFIICLIHPNLQVASQFLSIKRYQIEIIIPVFVLGSLICFSSYCGSRYCVSWILCIH